MLLASFEVTMSMALAHFAFGSAMTVLVVTYLVPNVPYPRLLGLVGGGWAMIPDFHWVTPVFRAELFAAHRSPLADLFWFHRTLDQVDVGDSKAVAAGMVAFLLLATALAERRQYRAFRVLRDAVDGSDTD